jgi:hypothetical protein
MGRPPDLKVTRLLDMSIYDLYQATVEGQPLIDRWQARLKGPPLYGSRANRNLVPLTDLPEVTCCEFCCAELIAPKTFELYWEKFENAHSRNDQDAVLGVLLFDPRGQLTLCHGVIEAWFGVGAARVRLVHKALLAAKCQEIGPRAHGGTGREAWNRTESSVLAEFKKHFFMSVKTNPEVNVVMCTRQANGPAEIIKQFFEKNPSALGKVHGQALSNEMERLLKEGGFDGLVKFMKDHNVCPKCEANVVGAADAEMRLTVARERGDAAATAHWEHKLKDINEHQVDHIAGHVDIRNFLTNITDLGRACFVFLYNEGACVDVDGEGGKFDPKKSYPAREIDAPLLLHADAAAAHEGHQTNRSTTGVNVNEKIPVEGIGNVVTSTATLYSMVEGGGSESADHIITSLLIYLFQMLNGEKIAIFIFDAASKNRNGMIVGAFLQLLVDASLIEIAMGVILQINHSKHWMDRAFGLLVTRMRSRVSIGVDCLFSYVEEMTTCAATAAKAAAFKLNPAALVSFRKFAAKLYNLEKDGSFPPDMHLTDFDPHVITASLPLNRITLSSQRFKVSETLTTSLLDFFTPFISGVAGVLAMFNLPSSTRMTTYPIWRLDRVAGPLEPLYEGVRCYNENGAHGERSTDAARAAVAEGGGEPLMYNLRVENEAGFNMQRKLADPGLLADVMP